MPVYNFSTFDDPSATSFVGTQAFGINDSGQIVGAYANGSGNHGFLLSGGLYGTLDDPSATLGTQAFGIIRSGHIVGVYADGSGNHGFLYNPNGGTYTTLDDPLATNGTFAITNGTFATGINASGQIVGHYFTNTGNHGFLYNPKLRHLPHPPPSLDYVPQ